MTESEKNSQEYLTGKVKSSLENAKGIVAKQKRDHLRLATMSIISSSAATLVAGVTAATGPAAGIGTNGWRVACIIAAVLGFVSTVSTGISQQFKTGEKAAEGKQCVGRLMNLDAVITTQGKSWGEIGQEYAEIVRTYPELV